MASTGSGPTLAVKDLIDVEGVPTTAGSKVVQSMAVAALEDAPLLHGARTADARIIGKANLYELAFGASGVNLHFGTPTNPLDRALIPGGSSSGSAVAVATGLATVAYGSDTGGSIRVPAAFCGITGLKTTHGRIPLVGVYPLSPTLDTVGPMASDIEGLLLGMQLLEPGFSASQPAWSIGMVRKTGVAIDPRIAQAVELVCQSSECALSEIDLPKWEEAFEMGSTILHAEAVASNRYLIDDAALFTQLSTAVQDRLIIGTKVTADRYEHALAWRARWQEELDIIFSRVQLLALPSVGFFPPPLSEAFDHTYTHLTMPFNLSGYPALSLPIPSTGPLPASLQLLGPRGSEELLLSTGELFERVAKAIS